MLHVDGKRPDGRPLKTSGIRQRYAWLPDDGVRVEHGMRVTTIGRTLRDVCAYEGLVAGDIAIDSVRRRMPEVSLGRWHEELLVGPRFKGAAVVREAGRGVTSAAVPWAAPTWFGCRASGTRG